MNENTIDNNRKPILNSVGKVYCHPSWSWDTGSKLADYDLWTILHGEGQMVTSGKRFKLRVCDSLLLRPGERYIFSHDPANPLTVIYIHYSYSYNKNQNQYLLNENIPPLYRNLKHSILFMSLIERIVNSKKPYSDALLLAVLNELSCIDDSLLLTPAVQSNNSELDLLYREIAANPGNNWDINELAKKMHYTKDHFIRVFKRQKNITPHEYILQARLNTAKNYLSHSSISIESIAHILGYDDVSYFSRQFRRKTGLRPTAYRRS